MTKVIVFWLVINDVDISKSKVYYKFYSIFDYEVGYTNSYGHEIISIFSYDDEKHSYIGANNYRLLYEKFKYKLTEKKIPLANKIIDFLIDNLQRLKKG